MVVADDAAEVVTASGRRLHAKPTRALVAGSVPVGRYGREQGLAVEMSAHVFQDQIGVGLGELMRKSADVRR